MKKLINEPKNFVDDTVRGIIAAYGDRLQLLDGDPRILLSGYPTADKKVGIVTAGGSGHLPMFLGYVGKGMLDGCAVGNVFASPASSKMAQMIRACDRGNGVLCLFGNYGGDKLNFEMACEEVEFDDIKTEMILVSDDVASAPKESSERRRGVAGLVYAYKIAGAAADRLWSLEQVCQVTRRALANIRSMGVATSPCILPEVGKPTFEIGEDEIEIGMGIHGEPGIEVRKMFYARVHERLSALGVKIYMPHLGEYATSMEMSGLSLTLFKLDPELKELLQAPAQTPFYTNLNKGEIV